MKQSSNHTAVVTGASRGIGKAIALALAKNGHSVALVARGKKDLAQLESEIEKLGVSVLTLACDVSEPAQIKNSLAQILAWQTPLLLINNAGMGGPFHRADEVSDEEWKKIFQTNIDSAFYFTRALLPHMKKAGFGRIINISSVQGLFGGALSSTYAATKHALLGYTKSVATEWGAYGITCNAICPGYTNTEMLANADAAVKKELLKRIPTGRFGTAEEVGNLAAYLAGPHAGYINGSVLTIDGGLSAHVAGSVPTS